MSHLKSRVGSWTFHWKAAPRGPSGTVEVEAGSGEKLEVSWKKDAQGIWVLLPSGLVGFDFLGSKDDDGLLVYEILKRGSADHFMDASVSYGSASINVAKKSGPKALKIRAQMPGKIIRILSEVGSEVLKDQPLLVMEAMKMENEIRAPQAGKISQIKVREGQTVETGTDLVLMESLNHG